MRVRRFICYVLMLGLFTSLFFAEPKNADEPKLEELRRRIFPKDYDENGKRLSPKPQVKKRGTYRRRPNLIPTKLEVKGALEKDMIFIQRTFDNIFDEELTPETFEEFMDRIYLTGNYTS